jgi:hypothetical protein
VARARGDISFIAAQLNLGSGEYAFTVDEAEVEHRLLATLVTGHLDLFDAVGELKETAGAGKKTREKVRAKAVANNGHTMVDGELPELFDGRFRKKLGLINENAVLAFEALDGKGKTGLKQEVCFSFKASPRANLGGTKAIVEPRLEQKTRLALFSVVVSHREKIEGFGRIHRAISKVELRHGYPYPRTQALATRAGEGVRRGDVVLS